jgi:hypothetical protein
LVFVIFRRLCHRKCLILPGPLAIFEINFFYKNTTETILFSKNIIRLKIQTD